MLKEKGFFHSSWNMNGKGVRHEYEEMDRNGDKIVIDHVTGLTWQQSGSPDYLTYSEAESYVRQLNDQYFAGCSGWRLPTLEEAMSLMESKKHGDLYLEPIFDRKQLWIWTADKASAGRAWFVYFGSGSCDLNDVDYYYYVRAVR